MNIEFEEENTIGPFNIDFFIKPDICFEINGKSHYVPNSVNAKNSPFGITPFKLQTQTEHDIRLTTTTKATTQYRSAHTTIKHTTHHLNEQNSIMSLMEKCW